MYEVGVGQHKMYLYASADVSFEQKYLKVTIEISLTVFSIGVQMLLRICCLMKAPDSVTVEFWDSN